MMAMLKRKSTLYLPIGIPGSGKTTWRELIKKQAEESGKSIGVISPDEIRMNVFKVEFDEKFEPAVWVIAETKLEVCLRENDICILDATNVTKKSREMPLNIARKLNSSIEAFVFNIHPKLADLRNSKRNRKVPKNIIYGFHYQLQDNPPTLEEGFTKITVINQFPTVSECKEMGGDVSDTFCVLTEKIPIKS